MKSKVLIEDLEDLFNRNIIQWEKFNNKTVAISGPYGMLASYIVFMLIFLNTKGIKVKILALGRNSEKAKFRFGEYVDAPYFRFIETDICEKIQVDDEKIDYFIHAASLASSQYYKTNPVEVLLPNSVGTYHLLELARQHPCSGFLFISSGEIYGKLEGEIVEDKGGFLDPMDIRSCYGESKRMGENMCVCYQQQYNIPVKIARCGHIYGPGLDLINDQRVFAEFVSNVVKGQDIKMKSDGEAIRTFCYISDATEAFFKILVDAPSPNSYNVANDECTISILNLAKMLTKFNLDRDLKVIREQPDQNYLQNVNVKHPKWNVEKLKALGWNPKFNLEDGFRRTIESFKYIKFL